MPDFVRKALEERGLMAAFRERPAYQQNDYLRWITQAVRQETKEKRLRQLLEELEPGGDYMKMAHRPSRRRAELSWLGEALGVDLIVVQFVDRWMRAHRGDGRSS